MNPHVSPEAIARFARGEVGERDAVQIALHIDVCSRCANEARAADPLSQAFASIDDPELPSDLARTVEQALRAPPEPVAPAPELLVSAGLLLAAGLLMAIGGDPVGLQSQLGSLALACVAGASVLYTELAAMPLWWSTTTAAVGFLACLLVARRLSGSGS